jgi:type II secretory ATPase GspE/PulE/Tfp pilus assembly ATPase PilB-like protein
MVVTSSSKAIQRAFRRLYQDEADLPTASSLGAEAITPVDTALEATVGAGAVDAEQSQRADELFRAILARAFESHCSDIHLEMLPSGFHVRFRVDGVLQQPNFGPLQERFDKMMREILSRVKILSKLDIAERRRPQDGSFQVSVERDGTKTKSDPRVWAVPRH